MFFLLSYDHSIFSIFFREKFYWLKNYVFNIHAH